MCAEVHQQRQADPCFPPESRERGRSRENRVQKPRLFSVFQRKKSRSKTSSFLLFLSLLFLFFLFFLFFSSLFPFSSLSLPYLFPISSLSLLFLPFLFLFPFSLLFLFSFSSL